MRTDDEVTAAAEVCGATWTAAVDHRHKCRHPDGHPGRHVCACRSWQEGRTPAEATDVEQMRISNRAWADALRERDEALAAVERVRALADKWEVGDWPVWLVAFVADLRDALDPDPAEQERP